MISLVLATILSVPFGFLSRMCGGMKPKLPLGLDQHIYAIPYALLGFLCAGPWGALVSYLTAFLGKRTGHGQYLDVGRWNKPVTPEKLDFIVRLFFGPDTFDNPKRDLCGMAVTGAAVTLGAVGCLLFSGHFLLALAVFLGGLMKSLAYHTGYTVNPFRNFSELDEGSELGELLTGIFGGLPVFFGIFSLLGL